jgi:hypothetical protein
MRVWGTSGCLDKQEAPKPTAYICIVAHLPNMLKPKLREGQDIDVVVLYAQEKVQYAHIRRDPSSERDGRECWSRNDLNTKQV